MTHWTKRILRFAAPQWPGVCLIGSLLLANVAVDLLRPWPLALVADHVLVRSRFPPELEWLYQLPGASEPGVLVAWLALGKLLVFLAAWLLRGTSAYLDAHVGNRITYGIGSAAFQHLQELSVRYHYRRSVGDLVQRVTGDAACGRDLVMGVILPGVSALVSLIAMAAVMWRINPSLSLLAIAVAPILLLLIRWFGPRLEVRATEQADAEGQMMGAAEQSLRALPVTQAFGLEGDETRGFAAVVRQTGEAYVRSVRTQLGFGSSAGLVTACGTAAVMVYGGLQVLGGALTVGGLLVVFFYLSALYAPMETLAYLTNSYAHAAAGARRVLAVLEVKERIADRADAQPLPERSTSAGRRVVFEDVTFGYEEGDPVLKNLSITLAPGETVALVGPSGAGKSTFVSLLDRFYDPWAGRILVDGADIRTAPIAELRSEIALVLQEPFLFPMSIADNIAYGRPGASREEIEAAARAAEAEEFILKLPEQYETVIGERGGTLSGGQRQRIAIARALLKDAPIVILDEPTSALDAETEWQLATALDHLLEGRTAIVIAHRMALARRADRILVLNHGAIVEQGTHDELSGGGGFYAEMLRMQEGRIAEVNQA